MHGSDEEDSYDSGIDEMEEMDEEDSYDSGIDEVVAPVEGSDEDESKGEYDDSDSDAAVVGMDVVAGTGNDVQKRLETFVKFAEEDKILLSGIHLHFWKTEILKGTTNVEKISEQLAKFDTLFIEYCRQKKSLTYLLDNIPHLEDTMKSRIAEFKTYVESPSVNYKCRYFIADSMIFCFTQVLVLGVVSFWTNEKIIDSIKNVLSNSHRDMVLCITVSRLEPQRATAPLPHGHEPWVDQKYSIEVHKHITDSFKGQREDQKNGQWLIRSPKSQVPLAGAPAQATTSSIISLCSAMDIIVRTGTPNPSVTNFITAYHENGPKIKHFEAVELWLNYRCITAVRGDQVYLSAVYSNDDGVPIDDGYVIDARSGTPYMIDYGVITRANLVKRINRSWDQLKINSGAPPRSIHQVYGGRVFTTFKEDLKKLLIQQKKGDNTAVISLSLAYKATIKKMSSDLWSDASKYVLLHMGKMTKRSNYTPPPQDLNDDQLKAVYFYIIGLGLHKFNLSNLKGKGPLGSPAIGRVGRIGDSKSPTLDGNGAHLETEGVNTAVKDSVVTFVFERNIEELDPFTMVVLEEAVYLAGSGNEMYPNPGLKRCDNYVTVETEKYNKKNDTASNIPGQFSGGNFFKFTEGDHTFGMPPGVREVGRCLQARNMYQFNRKDFFTMMLRVGGYGYMSFIVKKYTIDTSDLISMMVGVMTGKFPIEPENVEILYTYLLAIKDISNRVTPVDVSFPIYIKKFFRNLTGIEKDHDVTQSDLISVMCGNKPKKIESHEWAALSVYQQQMYSSTKFTLFGDVEEWLKENEVKWKSGDDTILPTVEEVSIASCYYISELRSRIEKKRDEIKIEREVRDGLIEEAEKKALSAAAEHESSLKAFAAILKQSRTPRRRASTQDDKYYLGIPTENLILNENVYDTLIKILGIVGITVGTPIDHLKIILNNKPLGFNIIDGTPYEKIKDLCEIFASTFRSDVVDDERLIPHVHQACLFEKIAHLTMNAGSIGIPNLLLNIYETRQVINVVAKIMVEFPEAVAGVLGFSLSSRDQLEKYVLSTQYVKVQDVKMGSVSEDDMDEGEGLDMLPLSPPSALQPPPQSAAPQPSASVGDKRYRDETMAPPGDALEGRTISAIAAMDEDTLAKYGAKAQAGKPTESAAAADNVPIDEMKERVKLKRQRKGGSRKTRKRKKRRKSPKTLRKRRKQVKTIKRKNKRRKSVLKKKSILKKKPSQKFKKTVKRIRKKRSKRSKK